MRRRPDRGRRSASSSSSSSSLLFLWRRFESCFFTAKSFTRVSREFRESFARVSQTFKLVTESIHAFGHSRQDPDELNHVEFVAENLGHCCQTFERNHLGCFFRELQNDRVSVQSKIVHKTSKIHNMLASYLHNLAHRHMPMPPRSHPRRHCPVHSESTRLLSPHWHHLRVLPSSTLS